MCDFKILKRTLVNFKCSVYYRVFGLFPIKKNKIVFMRHKGKGFGDHGKYIALELLRQNMPFELVWVVDDMEDEFPTGIRKIPNTDLRRIYELATAGIWIDNLVKHRGTRKRKGQFYLNTTHGVGISMKKFFLDEPAITEMNRKNVLHDGEIADVYLSGGRFITNVYKTAFRLKGTVIETGSPRVDILLRYSKEHTCKVKEKIGIEQDKKVLLFAPTFRKRSKGDLEESQFNVERLQKVLRCKWGGEWIFLFRFHPTVEQLGQTVPQKKTVFDVSHYDDMQELMITSDILITDYSSTMFEFSYMKKPVFLFTKDLQEYVENERGFYFNFCELPFSMAESEDELVENIESFSGKDYCEKLDKFHQRCGVSEDGHASQRVVRIIDGVINKECGTVKEKTEQPEGAKYDYF